MGEGSPSEGPFQGTGVSGTWGPPQAGLHDHDNVFGLVCFADVCFRDMPYFGGHVACFLLRVSLSCTFGAAQIMQRDHAEHTDLRPVIRAPCLAAEDTTQNDLLAETRQLAEQKDSTSRPASLCLHACSPFASSPTLTSCARLQQALLTFVTCVQSYQDTFMTRFERCCVCVCVCVCVCACVCVCRPLAHSASP